MSGSTLEFIISSYATLSESLSVADDDKRETILSNYLHSCVKQNAKVNDFKTNLEWFNVSRPLSLEKDLKGKVVVLDFFTYCCINCMHVLPDLKQLEDTYSVADGLVVIGVHSAKFDNEKDSDNILAAVQRYNISHPVVNDAEGKMWSELEIPCWPTLLIIGPRSEPLFMIIGEGHKDELFLYVESALKFFRSQNLLSTHPLPTSLSTCHVPKLKTQLSFPGKVAIWPAAQTVTICSNGNNNISSANCETDNKMNNNCGTAAGGNYKLGIADTGNHRVLIVNGQGTIQHIIGGSSSGFKNGNFVEARFDSPQGLVFHGPDLVYVADTNNHAIRQVNLETLTVTTLVGTGFQGSDYCGGKLWTDQAISSPWDLCLVKINKSNNQHGKDEEQADVLLIAMAGTHQIWAVFLQTVVWWKGKSMVAGTCIAVAGNGKEENRNNSYPQSASFAQPSGLTLAPELNTVFVADSESSSIRKISLIDGKVSAVAGGDRNPFNLFSFGDVDGKQYDAKLQHPLGLAWSSNNKKLFVADSYNHKIKVIDVETNNCSTFLGDGKPGDTFGTIDCPKNIKFSEPGGLCVSHDGEVLYIADTNNHCVKAAYLSKNIVDKISLSLPDDQSGVCEKFSQITLQTVVTVSPFGGTLHLMVSLSLPDGVVLTESAPQRWKLQLPDSSWRENKCAGEYSSGHEILIQVPEAPDGKCDTILINYKLFVCEQHSTCTMKTCQIPVKVIRSVGTCSSVTQHIHHTILK